jgi:hypothetical protein
MTVTRRTHREMRHPLRRGTTGGTDRSNRRVVPPSTKGGPSEQSEDEGFSAQSPPLDALPPVAGVGPPAPQGDNTETTDRAK